MGEIEWAMWANEHAIVSACGECFSITSSELECVFPGYYGGFRKSARDCRIVVTLLD